MTILDNNYPKKREDRYVPENSAEWEKAGFNLLFNGAFIVGEAYLSSYLLDY